MRGELGMSEKLMKKNNLYEDLKQKQESASVSHAEGFVPLEDDIVTLDDMQRTKVLSPARLITKRFFRNKLALVGLLLLIVMFLFAFAGPLVYPYSQTQIFYKFDYLNVDYASARERTEFILYEIPDSPEVRSTVVNYFNSYIEDMKAEGLTENVVIAGDGNDYILKMLGERVCLITMRVLTPIGSFYSDAEIARYDRFSGSFDWTGDSFPDAFQSSVIAAVADGNERFEYSNEEYTVARMRNTYVVRLAGTAMELYEEAPGDDFQDSVEANLNGEPFVYNEVLYSIESAGAGIYTVMAHGATADVFIASNYVFNSVDVDVVLSDEFKRNALFALYSSSEFTADGQTYRLNPIEESIYITDDKGENIASLGLYAIRRYTGQDSLSLDFKYTVQEVIEDMESRGVIESTFEYELHEIDAEGQFVYDESGNPVLENTEIAISRKNTGEYVLTCEQITYLIDIYASRSSQNVLGTDGDGMDILARMMYGGRISLMVGFVVVFIEIFIGVILGGIAGFFGGAIDALIMRIVDVFYCVPGYPILIIMGALFDKMRMDPYTRLMWLMVILGILGWATIARLVRGQILSLREQEFMHAQEATGMKNRKRIFRHLIPNVMPQLIVTATMGVGSVIIYESTLSFLGLGVKHPLATWGTMINSVTGSSEALVRYAYIWIPVGALICLTVIAFNFVGDGLRDAFDPKMKN